MPPQRDRHRRHRADRHIRSAALAGGSVGRFNFIVPNQCEDAHDNCTGPGSRLLQFDAFVKREVPKIEASPHSDRTVWS